MAPAGADETLASALPTTLDDGAPFDRVAAELAGGRRDPASIALPLWPARVVDRCADNVEIAAAHGLRKFFWVQHPGDKWRRRRELQREVQEEVAQRT